MLLDSLRAVRRELLLCVMTLLLLTAYVVRTSERLPERVATHFDVKGRADGWMTRGDHALFMVGFASGTMLVLGGFFYLVRFLPEGCWNIPNRGFHLAPENRKVTEDFMLAGGLKLTAAVLAFFAVLHLLLLRANAKEVPRIDGFGLALATCVLLGYLAVWRRGLFRYFSQVPKKTRR